MSHLRTPVMEKGSLMSASLDSRWASPAAGAALYWRLGAGVGLILLGILALANLTAYPVMWFDEGIHLHVPKALVRYGVYADYSSEGFRHYGPTMSVGPTVMLPVAAAFELAGVGLLQARLVMVGYMLLAVALFWLLARQFGSRGFAGLTIALLVTSRGVDFVYYGRQLLGEVPGLAFVTAGLICWFASWTRMRGGATAGRYVPGAIADGSVPLVAAGLCFGLAIVTKNQLLIVLAPGLALAWIIDRAYYRMLPFRAFLVPGVLMMACFAGWQALAVFYLGPSEAWSNFQTMRKAAAGAAMSFSPEQMRRAIGEVFNPALYSCAPVPALLYTIYRARERSLTSLRWMAIVALMAANLGWYVIASIGWPRYAFAAFSLGALLVARLACDIFAAAGWGRAVEPEASIDGGQGLLSVPGRGLLDADAPPAFGLSPTATVTRMLAGGALAVLIALTVAAPLALSLRDVLMPPPTAAAEMASVINATVPPDAIVETWEPEMGFLTDHKYHYPPPTLLITAVSHTWAHGQAPAAEYDFRAAGLPDYVLEGAFSKYVGLYPSARLDGAYVRKATIGAYTLYERRSDLTH